MAKLLDPALLEALDSLGGQPFAESVWRVTWAQRAPLAGSFGGGRWSPDGLFKALYTSLEPDGALAEAYYHLSKAPVFSSSHMRLNQIHVDLDNVVVLDSGAVVSLGVTNIRASASEEDHQRAQAIGEAAFMLDYQGIVVPSARYDGRNLMMFPERIDTDKVLTLLDRQEVNWPAWKERA